MKPKVTYMFSGWTTRSLVITTTQKTTGEKERSVSKKLFTRMTICSLRILTICYISYFRFHPTTYNTKATVRERELIELTEKVHRSNSDLSFLDILK